MQPNAEPDTILSDARALVREQRLVEADAQLSSALAQAPEHAALRFEHALNRFLLGYPAADLFVEALRRAPGQLAITGNLSLALAAEGKAAEAEALLRDVLSHQQTWLPGLKALATLRWTQGEQRYFADHFAAAVRLNPANPELWLVWFQLVAQARDWSGAQAILGKAQYHLGETPALLVSRLFLAVETGDQTAAEELIARTRHIRGDVTSLCRIRHALRQGDAKAAEAEALPLTGTPSAGLYWPYLSLAWRLLNDERQHWLDDPTQFIQHGDIGLTTPDLAELTDVLRSLHTMEAPYLEQTVRGGTQTDRSVLLRHEPILQRTRAVWIEAIRDHLAGLPKNQPGHPYLDTPRQHLLLSGSWSVRLRSGGHNVPHSHPMGWLSSSLYVSAPDATELGPDPAGHIAFGTPPPELGLDLPAYRTIAPQSGTVVTFPSTMWHSVVPFEAGERLMIALDIRKPDY